MGQHWSLASFAITLGIALGPLSAASAGESVSFDRLDCHLIDRDKIGRLIGTIVKSGRAFGVAKRDWNDTTVELFQKKLDDCFGQVSPDSRYETLQDDLKVIWRSGGGRLAQEQRRAQELEDREAVVAAAIDGININGTAGEISTAADAVDRLMSGLPLKDPRRAELQIRLSDIRRSATERAMGDLAAKERAERTDALAAQVGESELAAADAEKRLETLRAKKLRDEEMSEQQESERRQKSEADARSEQIESSARAKLAAAEQRRRVAEESLSAEGQSQVKPAETGRQNAEQPNVAVTGGPACAEADRLAAKIDTAPNGTSDFLPNRLMAIYMLSQARETRQACDQANKLSEELEAWRSSAMSCSLTRAAAVGEAMSKLDGMRKEIGCFD